MTQTRSGRFLYPIEDHLYVSFTSYTFLSNIQIKRMEWKNGGSDGARRPGAPNTTFHARKQRVVAVRWTCRNHITPLPIVRARAIVSGHFPPRSCDFGGMKIASLVFTLASVLLASVALANVLELKDDNFNDVRMVIVPLYAPRWTRT